VPDETMIADVGAVEEAPAIEAPETEIEETPAESTEETQPEVPEGEQPESEEGKAPVSLGDAVKNALNKFREADPKGAQILRKEHFENLSYKQTFPTVAEAQAAKETMELLGGEEGIATLQQDREEYKHLINRLTEGDRDAVEEFAKEAPEGLAKMLSPALEKVKQFNRSQFERAIAPHMADTFREKGLTSVVSRLLEDIHSGRQKEAFTGAQEVAKFLQGVADFAEQSKEQPLSEKEKEIQTKEQALNEREYKTYQGDVTRSAVQSMNSILEKELAPYLKGKTLTKEQKQGLVSDAYTIASNAVAANPRYMAMLKAHFDKRSPKEEVSRFITSHFKQQAGTAVKKAWGNRGFTGTAKPAPSNGKPASVTTIASKPPKQGAQPNEFSMARFNNRETYIQGLVTLNNGHKVKVDWTKV
jgi:hypothetical protein